MNMKVSTLLDSEKFKEEIESYISLLKMTGNFSKSHFNIVFENDIGEECDILDTAELGLTDEREKFELVIKDGEYEKCLLPCIKRYEFRVESRFITNINHCYFVGDGNTFRFDSIRTRIRKAYLLDSIRRVSSITAVDKIEILDSMNCERHGVMLEKAYLMRRVDKVPDNIILLAPLEIGVLNVRYRDTYSKLVNLATKALVGTCEDVAVSLGTSGVEMSKLDWTGDKCHIQFVPYKQMDDRLFNELRDISRGYIRA